jgi:hypothetical protein
MTSSSPTRIDRYTELLKSKSAEFRNREKLWCALKDYIHSAGGWTTSPLGDFTYMRVEIPELSEIPIRLAERNFRLSFVSPSTRNTGNGITPIDIIELKLSGR